MRLYTNNNKGGIKKKKKDKGFMVHLVGMEKWKYRKWRGDGKVEG